MKVLAAPYRVYASVSVSGGKVTLFFFIISAGEVELKDTGRLVHPVTLHKSVRMVYVALSRLFQEMTELLRWHALNGGLRGCGFE
ncbi:uncharacterized [Tachysurus ichikawai]